MRDETMLKPCPFCGGEAKLKQDIRYPKPECTPKQAFEVVCQNRDCIIGFVDARYKLTAQKAIQAWNRRVEGGKA